jgi:hypothetical protein
LDRERDRDLGLDRYEERERSGDRDRQSPPATGTRNPSHGEAAMTIKTLSPTKPSDPLVAGPWRQGPWEQGRWRQGPRRQGRGSRPATGPSPMAPPAAAPGTTGRWMWKLSRWMTPGEALSGTCVRLSPPIWERVLGTWP